MRLLILLPLLALAGCVSDQTRQDIDNSARAIDGAAASLPPSPQQTAIRENAAAISAAVGHPFAPHGVAP